MVESVEPVGRGIKDRLLRHVQKLRFPWLLALTAALFIADVMIPDMLPFVNEILLGLFTVVLATLKKRRQRGPDTRRVDPGGADPEGADSVGVDQIRSPDA